MWEYKSELGVVRLSYIFSISQGPASPPSSFSFDADDQTQGLMNSTRQTSHKGVKAQLHTANGADVLVSQQKLR